MVNNEMTDDALTVGALTRQYSQVLAPGHLHEHLQYVG
jgi:hypothetical protein